MKIDDFTQIEIQQGGLYRMVPEAQLASILRDSTDRGVLLNLISSYGTLLRIFRGIKDLNQSSLANQAGIERKALYLLEDGKTANPKIETHQKLAAVLGEEFNQLARALRFISN